MQGLGRDLGAGRALAVPAPAAGRGHDAVRRLPVALVELLAVGAARRDLARPAVEEPRPSRDQLAADLAVHHARVVPGAFEFEPAPAHVASLPPPATP